MTSGTVFSILSSVAMQGPFLLIYIIGIIVAVVRWPQHPRVSLCTVISLGIMLVMLITGVLTNLWFMHVVQQEGHSSAARMGTIMATINWIRLPFSIAAWALLLTAVFTGRDVPARVPSQPGLSTTTPE